MRSARDEELFGVRGEFGDSDGRGLRSTGEETLWIFDADFEDLSGDNAGWTSLDLSGTLEQTNYWHKDTIHITGFDSLGDSTWWCGTSNDCWRQPRGYGNDWTCILERAFPEVAEHTDPGDPLFLVYRQRVAMEHDYDYGYTEISDDGGETWTTVETVSNPGFAGHPGTSQDWDSTHPFAPGHVSVDLGDYAGQEISIRFRFESDGAYSSQDQYDNPPYHSVRDGAWQLDNIALHDDHPYSSVPFWLDDCELTGDNGWAHDNIPGSGQTGVVFERVLAPSTLYDGSSYCWWRPEGWWMAALDSESGRMVDGQNSWLLSPPIDISGVEDLVAQWDAWIDLGSESATGDQYEVWLSTGLDIECVMEHSNFERAVNPWPDVGAYLARQTDDWDLWGWGDWLVINWRLWNIHPAYAGWEHMTGVLLDRQRVGVPVGGAPTTWRYGWWDRFHDTFDVAEALADTAIVEVSDWDGIIAADLIVSSDSGETWHSSPMIREYPAGVRWLAPPPVDHIAPSAEIRYYFESTDGLGNVRTHPANAPEAYYEFSVLPIHGSASEPGILLVDKHGRTVPGRDASHRHTSEYYFREALDVLGFEYDVYDVEVPSGSTDQSNGPDSSAYKYYDTQLWFADEFDYYTIKAFDQVNLINWLGQASAGKERNLLLTGNEIGTDIVHNAEDSLSFYSEWLVSELVTHDVASVYDTLLVLRDAGGGFDFMTYDERSCPLRLLEWGYG